MRVPVYIARVTANCWKCKKEIPLIQILGYGLPDEPDILGSVSLVEEMEPNLLEFIKSMAPAYGLYKVKSRKYNCYSNACPHCDSIFGDFYVAGDVDTPFRPDYGVDYRDLEVFQYKTTNDLVSVQFGISGFGQEEEILAQGLKNEGNR